MNTDASFFFLFLLNRHIFSGYSLPWMDRNNFRRSPINPINEEQVAAYSPMRSSTRLT